MKTRSRYMYDVTSLNYDVIIILLSHWSVQKLKFKHFTLDCLLWLSKSGYSQIALDKSQIDVCMSGMWVIELVVDL